MQNIKNRVLSVNFYYISKPSSKKQEQCGIKLFFSCSGFVKSWFTMINNRCITKFFAIS